MQPLMFLHMGYPKTGTTALQQFFVDNEDKLLARGILYPRTGRIGIAHYALNFSLGIGEYDKSAHKIDKPASLRDALLREVSATPCRAVLVSSEYFITSKSAVALYEFFAEFDVRPIVYLRRHDHAMESSYGQSAKTNALPPWGSTIESFIIYQLGISTIPWDYLATLRKFAAAFGADKMIVRPFERAQLKPNLCADILNILGISNDTTEFSRPPERLNASPTPGVIQLLDLVQRANIAADVRRNVVSSLVQLGDKQPPMKSVAFLSPQLRNALVSRYRDSYSVIAREFLGRSNGVLFEESMPNPASPWTPLHVQTPQELVDLLLAALANRLRG
jgi:hypothetical protein